MKRNTCCSYCGAAFAADAPWPRTCAACRNISYANPIPVAVCLLPVDNGLLVVRRGIEPQRGKLALPGGYIDLTETWQEACARELREETQIEIAPAEVTLYRAHSVRGAQLLVFGLAKPRRTKELPPFVPSNEALERALITAPTELAFSFHTLVASDWFDARPSKRSAGRPPPSESPT